MRYWDTSALVQTLIEQGASKRMRAVAVDDPEVATCWNTPVECVSALARLERDGQTTAAEFAAALTFVRAATSTWSVVAPTDDIREQAFRLVRVHALRAGDAIQLASAIVASGFQPRTLDVVTLDARLAEAAEKEGFSVIT